MLSCHWVQLGMNTRDTTLIILLQQIVNKCSEKVKLSLKKKTETY